MKIVFNKSQFILEVIKFNLNIERKREDLKE